MTFDSTNQQVTAYFQGNYLLILLLWRRHPDSNRGIEVLQTFALPLGYAAICAGHDVQSCPEKLAGVAGFEPAHDGIRIHCLTAWRYPNTAHY